MFLYHAAAAVFFPLTRELSKYIIVCAVDVLRSCIEFVALLFLGKIRVHKLGVSGRLIVGFGCWISVNWLNVLDVSDWKKLCTGPLCACGLGSWAGWYTWYSGWVGGLAAIRAMVFNFFAVNLISGGFISKSALRKRWGEFFKAPRALVAHIASMVSILSAKNLGIGRLIHSAAAESVNVMMIYEQRTVGGIPHLVFNKLVKKLALFFPFAMKSL